MKLFKYTNFYGIATTSVLLLQALTQIYHLVCRLRLQLHRVYVALEM